MQQLAADICIGCSTSAPQNSLWITALVAAGSAVVGALVGGYVSYQGNRRLAEGQRRFRAAIRRKAKIYVPLKLELQQLHALMDADKHLACGIIRGKDDDGDDRVDEPQFALWPALEQDGRAASAVSTKVRSRMETLDLAIRQFSEVRASAGATFQAVGEPLFQQLSGNEKFRPGFDSYSMDDIVRDRQTPWHDWQWGDTGGFEEFLTRVNESDKIPEARGAVLRGEAAVRGALVEAMSALDEGIARISRREEKESPAD